ncbi:hypothetical protein GCM10009746_15470 [Microbacterium paludicola]
MRGRGRQMDDQVVEAIGGPDLQALRADRRQVLLGLRDHVLRGDRAQLLERTGLIHVEGAERLEVVLEGGLRDDPFHGVDGSHPLSDVLRIFEGGLRRSGGGEGRRRGSRRGAFGPGARRAAGARGHDDRGDQDEEGTQVRHAIDAREGVLGQRRCPQRIASADESWGLWTDVTSGRD